ncbi:MAG: 50S ribosomal protein L31, partial [Holosporales bacterium]|nr:50S ribosomal protein L31 [Holosporales bacterium]
RSTYGKPGEKITLDIDNKSHPAWTGQTRSHGKGGRADRFQRQYSGLGDI